MDISSMMFGTHTQGRPGQQQQQQQDHHHPHPHLAQQLLPPPHPLLHLAAAISPSISSYSSNSSRPPIPMPFIHNLDVSCIINKVSLRIQYENLAPQIHFIQSRSQLCTSPYPSPPGTVCYQFTCLSDDHSSSSSLIPYYCISIYSKSHSHPLQIEAFCTCPYNPSSNPMLGWCAHSYALALLLLDPSSMVQAPDKNNGPSSSTSIYRMLPPLPSSSSSSSSSSSFPSAVHQYDRGMMTEEGGGASSSSYLYNLQQQQAAMMMGSGGGGSGVICDERTSLSKEGTVGADRRGKKDEEKEDEEYTGEDEEEDDDDEEDGKIRSKKKRGSSGQRGRGGGGGSGKRARGGRGSAGRQSQKKGSKRPEFWVDEHFMHEHGDSSVCKCLPLDTRTLLLEGGGPIDEVVIGHLCEAHPLFLDWFLRKLDLLRPISKCHLHPHGELRPIFRKGHLLSYRCRRRLKRHLMATAEDQSHHYLHQHQRMEGQCCTFIHSSLAGSPFYRAHVQLKTILALAWCWVRGMDYNSALAFTSDVSLDTVKNWYRKFKIAAIQIVESHQLQQEQEDDNERKEEHQEKGGKKKHQRKMIGGPGCTIQIDDGNFGKMDDILLMPPPVADHPPSTAEPDGGGRQVPTTAKQQTTTRRRRRRTANEPWTLGLLFENPQEPCLLFAIPEPNTPHDDDDDDDDGSIMIGLIQEYVAKGTIIKTERHEIYECLGKLGYVHRVVDQHQQQQLKKEEESTSSSSSSSSSRSAVEEEEEEEHQHQHQQQAGGHSSSGQDNDDATIIGQEEVVGGSFFFSSSSSSDDGRTETTTTTDRGGKESSSSSSSSSIATTPCPQNGSDDDRTTTEDKLSTTTSSSFHPQHQPTWFETKVNLPLLSSGSSSSSRAASSSSSLGGPPHQHHQKKMKKKQKKQYALELYEYAYFRLLRSKKYADEDPYLVFLRQWGEVCSARIAVSLSSSSTT